ncbi:MAG: hypothetical protein Pars92KO_17500 [Parasphingorhabdus sp.]
MSDSKDNGGWILPLIIGSIAGALSSVILLSVIGDLTPSGVNYLDLAAVMLAAAGVLVTVLGVIFAIAAFWGFSQLKQNAVSAAETEAINEVREQIENGAIRDYISSAVQKEIDSPRMETRIKRRVDEVVMGNPEKDEELNYDNGEG